MIQIPLTLLQIANIHGISLTRIQRMTVYPLLLIPLMTIPLPGQVLVRVDIAKDVPQRNVPPDPQALKANKAQREIRGNQAPKEFLVQVP